MGDQVIRTAGGVKARLRVTEDPAVTGAWGRALEPKDEKTSPIPTGEVSLDKPVRGGHIYEPVYTEV